MLVSKEFAFKVDKLSTLQESISSQTLLVVYSSLFKRILCSSEGLFGVFLALSMGVGGLQ